VVVEGAAPTPASAISRCGPEVALLDEEAPGRGADRGVVAACSGAVDALGIQGDDAAAGDVVLTERRPHRTGDALPGSGHGPSSSRRQIALGDYFDTGPLGKMMAGTVSGSSRGNRPGVAATHPALASVN
jgi:hypothetical protein